MTANTTYNRSERVRQRRTQRSQENLIRTANNARLAGTEPLRVTSRTGMGSPILNRAATQQPRRKYVFAIARNAELSLPALPVLNPSWRLLSGLVSLAMMIFLGVLLFGPLFQVKTISFSGLERANQVNLEAILDLRNVSIVSVNPLALQNKLQAKFPELAAVSVQVSLPNSVSVAVRERQPVMAWKVKDKVYWIDPEGILFPANGAVDGLMTIESDDLPPLVSEKKVTGAPADLTAANLALDAYQSLFTQPKQQVDISLLNAAMLLTSQMPANATLVFSKASGLGWNDERGWKAYFGIDLSNIDTKLTLYQAIVDQLTQKNIKPVVISVEQILSPFYRLEH
jgi:cell division septal protein FtsQ